MRPEVDRDQTCVQRRPALPLGAWVEQTWSLRRMTRAPATAQYEHVLPSGRAHLAVRLDAPPLRLLDASGGRSSGHALVGGVRAGYYARCLDTVEDSVGAVLSPGAVQALFGICADQLADRHVALEDLWGEPGRVLRERLGNIGCLHRRLDLFEAELAARLQPARVLHPVVVGALSGLAGRARIDALVRASGHSHRHFNALFRSAVGLNPKAYARVRRFRQLLAALSGDGAPGWAELAVDFGYADQAHLVREFRALSGVSPSIYRRCTLDHPGHLPLTQIRAVAAR